MTEAEELTLAIRRVKLTIWEACSHQPEGEPDPALQSLMRDWTLVEKAALQQLGQVIDSGAKAEPICVLCPGCAMANGAHRPNCYFGNR